MNNHAFIDANNLHLSIKAQKWEIDYARFRKYLTDKYQITQAYIFIGYVPGNESLYTSLQQAGYITVFKPTLVIKKDKVETIKGNADAELVLHCARGLYLKEFDKAVIVTGDGDFHCLVEELDKQEKLQRLVVPNRHRYSQLLFKFIKQTDFCNGLRKKVGVTTLKNHKSTEANVEIKEAGAGLGTGT